MLAEVDAQPHAISVSPLMFQTEAATRAAVDSILLSPRIAARVGHDHRPAGYISHPDVRYLGASVDGHLVGVFTAIDSGFVEVDLHAAILPSALRHSRALGLACLDHVFCSAPSLARATAYVIEGLDSAVNYCRRLGFVVEGFRRAACMKDGRLVGVHVLGMTRSDWERVR